MKIKHLFWSSISIFICSFILKCAGVTDISWIVIFGWLMFTIVGIITHSTITVFSSLQRHKKISSRNHCFSYEEVKKFEMWGKKYYSNSSKFAVNACDVFLSYEFNQDEKYDYKYDYEKIHKLRNFLILYDNTHSELPYELTIDKQGMDEFRPSLVYGRLMKMYEYFEDDGFSIQRNYRTYEHSTSKQDTIYEHSTPQQDTTIHHIVHNNSVFYPELLF